MAYAWKVLRCTAFGSAFGGDEEWSTGFYMGALSNDIVPPTQATADAFLTRWQTFFTAANSSICSGYKTEGVRTTLYNASGVMDPAANFYAYPTVPFAGGGASTPQPAQISLVASLHATPQRGLASKGRMFLPGVNIAMGVDGRISSTNVTSLVTTLKTLFTGMNGDTNVPGDLINASKGGTGLGALPPVNRAVTNLLIGNVYDTQRRRRNTLTETYSTNTIP